MVRIFLKFFLAIFIIIFFSAIFLSYFGLETDRFDKLIKDKVNEVNKYVKIDFQKTKIHISPTGLNLIVKLQNPKILVKNNIIVISKFDLFLPLKSFFTSDFLLKKSEVAFTKNDIKDITKITNIFLPKIINNKLNKIFHKGTLEGEFIIPFKQDGSIGKNYAFSGKVSNATIKLKKDFSIENFTTEINHTKVDNSDNFKIIIKNGSIYDIKLVDTVINLKREADGIKTQSFLSTKGKLNSSQINKISKLLNSNFPNFKDIKGKVDLKTKLNFDLSKRFKVRNLNYFIEGEVLNLEIDTEEKKIIKDYLPEYDPKLIFKDIKLKLTSSKNKQSGEFTGLIKTKDNFDNFEIKEIYNYNDKTFDISGLINFTNSKIKISRLNYIKNYGKKSQIDFDLKFATNKYYNIIKLNYLSGKTNIILSNIKLNKSFEVKDFKKLEILTFNNEVKNNDFIAIKSDNIKISGAVFDAEPLLKTLYKKNEKKTFSKNFNSKIKINFEKALTGTNDEVSNIGMIASLKKGSYEKLSLKGNFSKDEIVEMSIYQIDKDKKTLQVISDRARPFIKNFKFIKGFEGGKLEYESTISNKISNSNLIITDFKVSKVPALAQLLTLASLQGIADTLSGEGIRFESFEMKSNSEENVLNIEDALAIGPAVSILLEGYVDKGKVVSLRGTLVPATKLNAIIASIPLVGDILVGKKMGEGVVGVSFKMKGPPKDIKTSVNPIKTLTPRFIVRAIEKMKKKKKEEAK